MVQTHRARAQRAGAAALVDLHRLLLRQPHIEAVVEKAERQIVRALEAGASGYLLKDTPPEDIIRAIREIQDGGAPMSREVARKLISTFHRFGRTQDNDEALTPREEEILRSLSKGLLYKEISDRLGITVGTVCTHIKSIYRKLHVRSRTEAVMKFRG